MRGAVKFVVRMEYNCPQCRKEAATVFEIRWGNPDIGESTGVPIYKPDPDRHTDLHSKVPRKLCLVNDGTFWLYFVSELI